MALRKASAYSKKKARPYTRNSRRKGKAYIKAIPFSKIVKYHIGNQVDYQAGKHPFMLKLISEEGVQIRDTALEATRMLITKMMDEQAPGQYFFNVKVHPHHMMRENKTAAGAGADRMSTGMTQSFGIVIGRAALVKPRQEILFVSCANEKSVKVARDTLHMVKAKIPGRTKILFEKIENSA